VGLEGIDFWKAMMEDKMIKTDYEKIPPYKTKDGSIIRELLHPDTHGETLNQSLAEATVSPGAKTLCHHHVNFSEIYHVTRGSGALTVGKDVCEIHEGDSVYISPGTPHWVRNTGVTDLRILCCCAPPYTHEGTLLHEA